MNTTKFLWTSPIIEKFQIKRNLVNNEFDYQEVKANSNLCKRKIGLYERAQSIFAKKGDQVNTTALNTQITELKEQQKQMDARLVDIRNPDESNLATWIDLHGATVQQGQRIVQDHLTALQ